MIVNCPQCQSRVEVEAGEIHSCECGAKFSVDEAGELHPIEPNVNTAKADGDTPTVAEVGVPESVEAHLPERKRSKIGQWIWCILIASVAIIVLISYLTPGSFIRLLLARLGDTQSQLFLGWNYYYGEGGVAKDYDKAVYWYRKAAESGNVRAQHGLALCYDFGRGVAEDHEDAAYWYRRSAEQGYFKAQLALGFCYYNGDGVPKDLKKAAHWWQKAAEQGYADAQFNLGLCYENGDGVPKDLKKAAYWYGKAAEQGHPEAQKALKELGK